MRVSALLNAERQGLLTENGNVIGRVTVDGTLELLLFGGLFGGVLAGFVWVLVRDWLPSRGARRLAMAALVAACLGSFSFLTEGLPDFQMLSPAWLHLLMFLLLLGIAGGAIALMDPFLDQVLPRGRVVSAVYACLALPVGLVAMSVLAQALVTSRGSLWLVALALLVVLVADLVSWRARYLGGSSMAWLRLVGVTGISAACAVEGLYFSSEAWRILN